MLVRDLVIIAVALIFVIGITLYLPKHGEIVYNCSISEISPDYPVQVKEACRKLRMETVK